MKSKILSLIIAATMIFSTAAVSFAGTDKAAETYNKFDLKVISNDETAVSVAVDNNYKATVKLENDVVNQESVTLDLTMQNVGSLGIDEARHADFTLNTGMEPKERALTQYMPNLNTFKSATVNGSINGKAFTYEVEGTTDGKAAGEATGEWTATPTDVEEVRAAWHEMTGYVETTTYEEDDSYVFIPNTAYLRIGTELLCFEEGSKGLELNNLNETKGLEANIRENVKLVDTEVAADAADMEVMVPAGTILRVGGSEAKLTEDTTIKVNGVELAEGTLDNFRDAEGMYALVQEALYLVDDVLGSINGSTMTVEITTADWVAEQEAIADAKETIKELDINAADADAVADAREKFDALPEEVKAAMPEVENTLLKAELKVAEVAKENGDKSAKEEIAKIEAALGMTKLSVKGLKVAVSGSKVTVSWEAVAGADSYTVQLYRNGKAYGDAKVVTGTTYTKSKATRGVKYTAKVTPSVTYKETVYTGVAKTSKAVASKLSKANISAKKSGKYVVVKSDYQYNTKYQIYISKDKKFKKSVTKVKVEANGKALNKKLTTSKYFKSGKNYVKVRAYTTVNGVTTYGDWSKVKTVKR